MLSYTPATFARAFLSGNLPEYDAAVTFSSIEHAGLGRFGDAINPWGDIMTVAKIRCVLKDNGLVLVGVPMDSKDIVNFNRHRC